MRYLVLCLLLVFSWPAVADAQWYGGQGYGGYPYMGYQPIMPMFVPQMQMMPYYQGYGGYTGSAYMYGYQSNWMSRGRGRWNRGGWYSGYGMYYQGGYNWYSTQHRWHYGRRGH